MTTGTNPPQPQPWPPPQRDKPRSGIRNALTGRWAFLAIGFIIGAIIGGSGNSADTTATPGTPATHTVTVTADTPDAPAPPPPPDVKLPADGVSMVGVDVAPGTYRAAGEYCYWARLKGTSGEFGDIIANSNGPGVVTIAATDKAFESRRCQWTKV